MQFTNGIKAILFDFDGTLKHHLPTGGEVFTDYVISLGLTITDEDRRRAASGNIITSPTPRDQG
jgi:beta-phosphoglucomutase-like phosphatase (HAD superfamily)